METIFWAAFPLVLLIGVMIYKDGVPSYIALPVVALLVYGIQLFAFKVNPAQVNASVLAGVLVSATPLLILWGAIFFFKTLEVTGSLSLIKIWLNSISPHPVAQLMLIGWAFSFFIEGISGFGTPAVMAAPLLVSLGFAPFRVIVFCLALNTVPVSFGAVGTPMWFGFGELNLTREVLRETSYKTALLHSAAALVIPLMALSFVTSWHNIRKNWLFIYLSITAALFPYVFLSRFNVEFPAIAGGFVSLAATVFFAKKGWGLSETTPVLSGQKLSPGDLARAFLPFFAVIFLLMLTRIKALGLQPWLNTGQPWLAWSIPGLGDASLSTSLVLELRHILGTTIQWKHALLYVPSFIPFAVVALACLAFHPAPRRGAAEAWRVSLERLVKPLWALLGAMVFVKLYMLGGEQAPAALLGANLADTIGRIWNFSAVYLGALGSFFAGSCTISNLTFGPIQVTAAERLGMSIPLVLSLQSVGGAMGNMACIHNIVSVCAMLGLQRQEGRILRKTFVLVVIYGAIAGIISLFL